MASTYTSPEDRRMFSPIRGFQRRPQMPGDRQATGQSNQGIASLVKKSMTPSGDYLGVSGALNPPPQVSAFYQALLGQAQRGIGAQTAGAERSALESLESRGLGTSSLVGRTMGEIGRGAAVAGQQAATSIQGLQFQQLLAALDYERQKELMRLQAKYNRSLQGNPWLSALGNLGGSLAMLFPGGGGASAGGGNMATGWSPSFQLGT